jgi:hypothetical protein
MALSKISLDINVLEQQKSINYCGSFPSKHVDLNWAMYSYGAPTRYTLPTILQGMILFCEPQALNHKVTHFQTILKSIHTNKITE